MTSSPHFTDPIRRISSRTEALPLVVVSPLADPDPIFCFTTLAHRFNLHFFDGAPGDAPKSRSLDFRRAPEYPRGTGGTVGTRTIENFTAMTASAGNCWVVIYEDEGYQDASLLVTGPSAHSNLKNLPGANRDWGDDIDSLVVGPGCWLQVFADENFQDTSAWYGPNSHIPGLGDMGDEIDSMRLYDHPPAAYFDFLRRSAKS